MKAARLALGLLTLLAASACASSRGEPVAASPASPGMAPGYVDSDRPISEGAPPLAESDRPVAQRAMPWADPTPPPYSPYGVELLSGDYRSLPRYYANGRGYVLGMIGELPRQAGLCDCAVRRHHGGRLSNVARPSRDVSILVGT